MENEQHKNLYFYKTLGRVHMLRHLTHGSHIIVTRYFNGFIITWILHQIFSNKVNF